jgi:ribonuclease G
MYISSSPHETKVAVLEDDQLVEVYFERDTDVGLVGGIYKGRVSRVLPGMQSAFVDIGLERDAFLYVSDFFYEDQEEYDKVFEEAETRATKFTAQQAETSVAPIFTEPAPAVVAEVAPPPTVLPIAPPLAPPLVEPPAATVAPPSGPRESHERRPFDMRRGRRRRHRGRPDFAEGRRGDRPFPPPHRPEEPPTESHPFEILPGESLAKYSHATPAQIEKAEAGTPEVVIPGIPASPQGKGEEWEGVAAHDKMSEGDESVEGKVLAGKTDGMSAEALPTEVVAEAAPVEPVIVAKSLAEAAAPKPTVVAEAVVAGAVVAEALPVAPPEAPAAVSAVVDDATLAFIPSAMHSVLSSAAAASAPAEVAAAPASVPMQAPTPEPVLIDSTAPASAAPALKPQPAAKIAEPTSVAEAPVSSFAAEAAPFHTEAAPFHPAQGVAGPSSGESEPREAAEAAGAHESAIVPPEFAEVESASDAEEADAAEEGVEGEEESLEEAELLAEASEGQLDDEGELPAEGADDAQGDEQNAAQEATPGDVAPPGGPGAPGDRTYTLREPHQRPRFAPRGRRRGRRGPGDRGPRRFDKPRESPRPGGNHHPVQIAEVLKEGQEILVQIAKEPLGTKGARITSHVALPGRYLVYMPTIEHIGVSRKIASEEERLRLRNIILENKGALTGGFIVRTAGQGRPEEEFKADLKFLSTLWAEIRAKHDRLKAPALLHRDLDLVQRLLRDLLTPDFKCVRVDSEIDYERVLDFVARCQPGLVGKVKLYSRDTPLYEEFGIQTELDKALKPKVWLKSGGYIVINQTEALVAIDVNTGKYVGKTNRLEDTIVKTNVDAVNEIVRQVRLRDLGGIIVIDFIDMDERKNRARVVQALEEALRSDRAPTKVISFNDFGLVAVTRKRVKQSLERTLCQPCDYCTGSGWVKSVNTVCNEILAEARKMAKGIDGDVMTLRVHPEVAKALKSREGNLISELESLTKKDVIVKSDPNVHQERFEIY